LWLGQPQCSATWEPASSLPLDLIEDYEAGISRESTLETKSMYGHVFNTMTIKRSGAPETKKKKLERACIEDLEGYLLINNYI